MNKVNGGFSEGFKVKGGKNLTKVNKNKKLNDKSSKQYPNGLVPFILFGIVFIILIACVFGIGFSRHYEVFSDKKVWTNSLICISTVIFLLNVLWLIGRSGFSDILSYSLMKFARVTKTKKIREKIEFYVQEPAIDTVSNYVEYKEYATIKRKNAKKWFIISFITYTSIFVICLIICLPLQLI